MGDDASSINALVNTIFQQYAEHDDDTVVRVQQSLFKVYNQTLRKLGDNDVRVVHTGVRTRHTLERVVRYDGEAFENAWGYPASNSGVGVDNYFIYV